MFALIMFAIIGAELNLGAWYWIAYGGYVVFTIIGVIIQVLKN